MTNTNHTPTPHKPWQQDCHNAPGYDALTARVAELEAALFAIEYEVGTAKDSASVIDRIARAALAKGQA